MYRQRSAWQQADRTDCQYAALVAIAALSLAHPVERGVRSLDGWRSWFTCETLPQLRRSQANSYAGALILLREWLAALSRDPQATLKQQLHLSAGLQEGFQERR
jgi:hypothetical protein